MTIALPRSCPRAHQSSDLMQLWQRSCLIVWVQQQLWGAWACPSHREKGENTKRARQAGGLPFLSIWKTRLSLCCSFMNHLVGLFIPVWFITWPHMKRRELCSILCINRPWSPYKLRTFKEVERKKNTREKRLESSKMLGETKRTAFVLGRSWGLKAAGEGFRLQKSRVRQGQVLWFWDLLVESGRALHLEGGLPAWLQRWPPTSAVARRRHWRAVRYFYVPILHFGPKTTKWVAVQS